MSAHERRSSLRPRSPHCNRLPLAAWTLLLVCLPLLASSALAQELVRDKDYWYVPEHEKYMRSEFFAEPSFKSAQVRITRVTTFRYIRGSRGWAIVEFDGSIKAHIPLRLLRLAMYDPAAVDPWYEFKRASVFSEDPGKIEARLKGQASEPRTTDSKVPIWKRYKERWSINQGRSGSVNTESDPGGEPARPTPEKKARNRYPLLDPIGPRTSPQEPRSADEATPNESDTSTAR